MSRQPPVRRDLSLAVDAHLDAELLGDRVRAALGGEVDLVESLEVASETAYDALPSSARARMGMTEGQKNVLLRVLLRHPTRTLTDAEANRARDLVYAALHEGSRSEWAAPPRADE